MGTHRRVSKMLCPNGKKSQMTSWLRTTLTPIHFEHKGEVLATYKHPWTEQIAWGDTLLIKGKLWRVIGWCDLTSTFLIQEPD
jgi:hypothetical protein